MKYDFAVVGGDRRHVYLANELKNRRYRVFVYGVEERGLDRECKFADSLEELICHSKCIIGPILFTKDGKTMVSRRMPDQLSIEILLEQMRPDQSLFAGCFSKELLQKFQNKGIKIYDFMKMDDVAIYNAIATAEGAIVKAMELKPINLHGSKCLVLGYGRCGKVLTQKLKGLDAKVAICARDEVARSQGESNGFECMDFDYLYRRVFCYDYIFNTVPSMVIRKNVLKRMCKDTCILDIATFPGGVDLKAAKELRIPVYLCPSLPEIFSPKSSGVMLAQKVIKLEGRKES